MIDEKKMREKLDQILDFMQENKLISKEACEKMKEDKDGFLNQMVQDLSNSGMEDKDIRDVHFQKKLMGTLVSHSLGMKEAVTTGMTALTSALKLKDENPENTLEKTLGDPEANKALDKLQAQVVVLSGALNKEALRNDSLTPSPKPDFNTAAKEMMAEFNKNMEDKLANDAQQKKEFQELSKEMEKELAETLRNAYDGADPRFTGGVQATFDEPIKAFTDFWIEPAADPNSLSARVQEATDNRPGNDPLGVKSNDKANSILSPIIESVTSELERQDKMTPRPQIPK